MMSAGLSLLCSAGLGLGLIAAPAAAQTSNTNCTGDNFGNVHCTTTQRRGFDWNILQPQNTGGVMDAFNEGVRQGQERRLRQAQIQAAEAQARAAEAQARAAEAQAAAPPTSADPLHWTPPPAPLQPTAEQLADFCSKALKHGEIGAFENAHCD